MAAKHSVNDLHIVCLCAGATCGFELLLESSIIAEDISLWEYTCLAIPTWTRELLGLLDRLEHHELITVSVVKDSSKD